MNPPFFEYLECINDNLLFTSSGRGLLFEMGGMGHGAGRREAVRRELPQLNITTPTKACTPVIMPSVLQFYSVAKHKGGW